MRLAIVLAAVAPCPNEADVVYEAKARTEEAPGGVTCVGRMHPLWGIEAILDPRGMFQRCIQSIFGIINRTDLEKMRLDTFLFWSGGHVHCANANRAKRQPKRCFVSRALRRNCLALEKAWSDSVYWVMSPTSPRNESPETEGPFYFTQRCQGQFGMPPPCLNPFCRAQMCTRPWCYFPEMCERSSCYFTQRLQGKFSLPPPCLNPFCACCPRQVCYIDPLLESCLRVGSTNHVRFSNTCVQSRMAVIQTRGADSDLNFRTGAHDSHKGLWQTFFGKHRIVGG